MAFLARPLGTRAWMILACGVPTALIFWTNAAYVWNHFVAGGYYHDSAWYSAIVYHAGFFQKNPGNTSTVPDYWGIHVSLLCSVTSLLSYLAPVPRVLWYALFQGAIYAPLGTLVALTIDRARRTLLDALLVVATNIVFATNGQVVACIGYPHFEIFLAAGLCVMLVGLVTGRERLAWGGLAMAVVTREDGGFHAASFAAAAIACGWLGKPFAIAQKKLWTMLAVAFVASLACFGVQKAFFVTANLFRVEYLGDSAFHHVTLDLVAKRLPLFFTEASFVAFPLVGTIAIAIARRDARYLLGYAVELPWLLLNFFAHQELKATFTIYTGFPFIGSIFWVGVYGRLTSKESSRGWLASLSFVSVLATLGIGLVAGRGHLVNVLVRSGPLQSLSPAASVYVHTLEKNAAAYGELFFDSGMGAWVVDTVPERRVLFHPTYEKPWDAIVGATFYIDGTWGPDTTLELLAKSPFHRCGRAAGSPIWLCYRDGHAFPPGFEPVSIVAEHLKAHPIVRRDVEGFHVPSTPTTNIQIYGPYLKLSPGDWTATWKIQWNECIEGESPRAILDVNADGKELVARRVEHEDDALTLAFTLDQPRSLELRTWSGRCAFVVRDVVVGAVPPRR